MKLELLQQAISIIRDEQAVLSLRQITYLRTYPAIILLAATPATDPKTRFLQLATATYGWMPRVLRLESEFIEAAVEAFTTVIHGDVVTVTSKIIEPIAECLSSAVGASKLLHFALPNVYPIWDTKVQRVWSRRDPTQYHMSKVQNYLTYAKEVHALRGSENFSEFVNDFQEAYAARLNRLRIASYRISDIRAIESAAFELSGGEYEGD